VLVASQLAEMDLAAIKPKHDSEFVAAQVAREMSGSSIRIYLALLSHPFTVVAREWEMDSLDNSIRLARRPKLEAGRERTLTPEAGNADSSQP